MQNIDNVMGADTQLLAVDIAGYGVIAVNRLTLFYRQSARLT